MVAGPVNYILLVLNLRQCLHCLNPCPEFLLAHNMKKLPAVLSFKEKLDYHIIQVIILWLLPHKMCQSCPSLLISHWDFERILMSVRQRLAQTK